MTTEDQNNELLDRARNVIRELREKLVFAEARSNSGPIAIVGMACDFPGVRTDLDAFWQMIVEGRDAVGPVPEERWDAEEFYAAQAPAAGKMNTRHAAFLGDVARFDAAFFEVTPVEAVRMDPQQRIFLETAWHALEGAGLSRAMLDGSETGVFVGVHSQSADYWALQCADLDSLDAYASTGTALDMIAGRLAYWLNLQGPSVVVNTACSSSLVALHLACRSLRAGDCSAAVAGGVNLFLSPTTGVAESQLQMLAPDGRSKAFDSRADGFGRGEGCGVVILKRLADAVRDGDRVLAAIRGSAINQDGRTNGLTAPNGLSQQRLLRSALKDGGVSAAQVGYVEAHGTGTPLGDPIEVEALAAVMGAEKRSSPCVLGAVKANIGHLEGAAGIAGIIKTVLVLKNGYLPPVANLKSLNPHLALEGSGLSIPMHGQPWQRAGRRFAGVSGYGFSGSNAHVILEEAPEDPSPADPSAEAKKDPANPILVAVSAQTPEALRGLARAYAERIECAGRHELRDISYTSTVRRTHHAYRIAAVGSDRSEIASSLRAQAEKLADAEQRRSPEKNNVAAGQAAADSVLRLRYLAKLYAQGGDVDWKEIHPAGGRTVSLPRYPFQGRRYWLEPSAARKGSTEKSKAPDDWFYAVDWIEQQLKSVGGRAQADAVWLIFDDAAAFGETLVARIHQLGGRAFLISKGATNGAGLTIQGGVRRGAGEMFDRLWSEGVRFAHAVYVAGNEQAAELTADALGLAQGTLRSKLDVKLWIVTQRVQDIPGHGTLHQQNEHRQNQAALWGFSRVFALEQPERAGGVIDLDCASIQDAIALYEEIVSAGQEDRIVLRDGKRFVPRLRRRPAPALDSKPRLREQGCYLVTGAFGAIGLDVAEWLVKGGARHLVLAGRRKPGEMQKPGVLDRLATLQSKGVTIQTEVCDVSDPASVELLFRDIDRCGRPLYGVIHAAAAMTFSSVSEAAQGDVEVAFRAKVTGARLLDQHTREKKLDFFVLFSSAAVSVGSRNASLYAAANSCLNALAADRRSLGLPALSVEWGLWEPSSEAAQRDLITSSGFVPMPSAKTLDALDRLLASGLETGVVAAIDWTILYPALEIQGKDAVVAEFRDSETLKGGKKEPSTATEWLAEILRAPANERFDRLMAFVSGQAKTVFGMPAEDPLDENRGLFQMGMNSLMSVQLKRRLETGLGLKLPGTLTLTYPTVTALAGFLQGKLFEESHNLSVRVAPQDRKTAGVDFASVAAMNESETDAAIAAELAAIQRKLGVQ